MEPMDIASPDAPGPRRRPTAAHYAALAVLAAATIVIVLFAIG